MALRLHWQALDSMDGWYAEVSPRRVRTWEKDPNANLNTIERELSEYGDYARYGQDRNGKTWLCVYVRA